MNSIVRNFVFVISRFKMASFLNVAGLSVAFTAFLILFMQVRYEWGYDRFHKHADRLYRLEIVHNNKGAQVVLNRPLIDRFLASSPHIEEGALINRWGDKKYITVDRDGERMTFHEELYACYPSYARVFNFDMVEGEAAALEEKGRVLIPASMAHRFFGNHPAVGQVLIGEGWTSEVGGVYRDFPSNSIVGAYRTRKAQALGCKIILSVISVWIIRPPLRMSWLVSRKISATTNGIGKRDNCA